MPSNLDFANYSMDCYSGDTTDLGGGIQYKLHIKTSYCVLAVRGTNEKTDWKTNLRFMPRWDKHCGLCHYGYLKAARLVAEDVYKRLVEEKATKKVFYFTGHSMGGSVAGLAAMLLSSKYGIKVLTGSLFGASKPFVLGRPKLDFGVLCFRNEFDPVVRSPLGFWGFAKNKTLHTAFGHSMICYVNNLKNKGK